MSTTERCGNCAYADKRGKTMWCPFHDEPIHSNMVCDDFLDEYQSPQWIALIRDESKNSSVAQYTGKDITAYVVSIFLIIMSIACFQVKL